MCFCAVARAASYIILCQVFYLDISAEGDALETPWRSCGEVKWSIGGAVLGRSRCDCQRGDLSYLLSAVYIVSSTDIIFDEEKIRTHIPYPPKLLPQVLTKHEFSPCCRYHKTIQQEKLNIKQNTHKDIFSFFKFQIPISNPSYGIDRR